MKPMKKFMPLLLIIVVDLVLGFFRPALALQAAGNTLSFLLEVITFLPLVMILMGLFDAWVPRQLVETHVGPGSGLRGMLLAMLLGTAAAGPLYAAFPIALALKNKGARMANLVIFLSTWAAIKVPMVLMESRFVGLNFALLRLALTIPAIVGAGLLMERLMPREEAGA